MSARRINSAGLILIKSYEGLRLQSYKCPAGVWTIGYGHTSRAGAPAVTPGMVITELEAVKILQSDLVKFEQGVAALVTVPLSDNQFATLVSFAFNLGLGALQRSSLLRKLNAGNYADVPAELARWNKAGGKVLRGLEARRAAEAKLWLTPDDVPQPKRKPFFRRLFWTSK